MNGLIEFLTTEEMIVVYVLLGIASVLGLIVYFLDKTHNKRRQRQNTRELRKIVDEVAPSNSGEIQQNVELVLINKPEVKTNSVVAPVEVVPPVVEVEKESVQTPVVDSVMENVSAPVTEVISSPVTTPPVVEVAPTVEMAAPVVENLEPLDVIDYQNDVKPVSLDQIEEKSNVVNEVNNNVEMLNEINEEANHQSFESDGLQYTSIEPDPSEAQAELMRLTEVLEKAEEETKNIDLTAFEEEQEQNAIISLDELMSRNKALYESGELEKLEDEGNEPISIQDLEERMKAQKEVTNPVSAVEEPVIISTVSEERQMSLDDFQSVSIPSVEPVTPVVESVTPRVEEKPVYQEHKKFKSSPVISPVYGIEKPVVNSSSDIELENTANYEKLDEEIRKTNEFLMTLRELQKKLD